MAMKPILTEFESAREHRIDNILNYRYPKQLSVKSKDAFRKMLCSMNGGYLFAEHFLEALKKDLNERL